MPVQAERPGLVDQPPPVREGEGRCAPPAAVGIATGLDGGQRAGVTAVQQSGDERLTVLGEPCQQLEMPLDRLPARLAQDPGQHRVGGQELRQLAPSDEPVGEVQEPFGRGVAGQLTAVAGAGELQHQRPRRQLHQPQPEPMQELLGQDAGVPGGDQIAAGRGEEGFQAAHKRLPPVRAGPTRCLGRPT